MEITTIVYLNAVLLLTTNSLIKCEEYHDNGIDHKLQPVESFSDHHLDHFDKLDYVESNNSEPMVQFQIDELQLSGSGEPILNNDFDKVIQRVEIIHHDGDSVTKYETTSHTNDDENDELFDDSLISSLQSSTTPGAYTKMSEKTVIKKNQNSGKNSQESNKSTENMYSKNRLNKIEFDNSMSKTQSSSNMEDIGIPMMNSEQFTDLYGNLKKKRRTKVPIARVLKVSASGSKSNELNGSIKRIYNTNLMPSNNVISTTSSLKSNDYSDTIGSSQRYPNRKDRRTRKLYRTKKVRKNETNNRPLKKVFFKPGNSFRGKKTMTKKYKNTANGNNDLNEHDNDPYTDRIKSSNNIMSTTSSTNANYNGGSSSQSYPITEDDTIETVTATKIADKNGSNDISLQKIFPNPGNSFKGEKIVITEYHDYDDDYSDLGNYDVELNTENARSSTTEIKDKNDFNGIPHQKIYIKPRNSFEDNKTILKKYDVVDDGHDDFDEYKIYLNTDKIRSSNNIASTTRSSNDNYNDLNANSVQNYPMGEDGTIKTITTKKITGNNDCFHEIPRQRKRLKPGSLHNGKKIKITKCLGNDNDFRSLDEHNYDYNIENARSSNNIVSTLNPSEYNELTTTTTIDRDNTTDDLLEKKLSQKQKKHKRKAVTIIDSELESSSSPQMNYDSTYSLPQTNQKVNLGSFRQTQTEIIKSLGESDESNYGISNDHGIEYNMDDEKASQKSNEKSNYMVSSLNSENGNDISSYITPLDTSISGGYSSSITNDGKNKNINGLRKRKRKNRRKKKFRNGSFKKMRPGKKSFSIRNRRKKMQNSKRRKFQNSRLSRQRYVDSQLNESNEMISPKSSSFSESYSYDSSMSHEMYETCNCNDERKSVKRQSSERNENNFPKNNYDLINRSVENYINVDNLPMLKNGDEMIQPPFGALHKNDYVPHELPPVLPLPLLLQIPPQPFYSPPEPPGLQMNPFDSLRLPKDKPLPPYPYSSFIHSSPEIPVEIDLEEENMKPKKGEQEKVDAEFIQTQQDNTIGDSRVKEISTLNSKLLTASTQSIEINNTSNGPTIEYNKTIKTTENIGENGIPEVQVDETLVKTLDDFTGTTV